MSQLGSLSFTSIHATLQTVEVILVDFPKLAAMNFEQLGDDLTADENKYWREKAEYERYTKPLLLRLRAIKWPALLALHSARWHRGAIEAIRARTPMFHYCSSALSHQELIKESQKHKPSGYGWIGSYYNAHTSRYRQIQRYPLIYIHDTGTYPVRFCPPEGPPVTWGFWFRTSDFTNFKWTPETRAWRNYQKTKELHQQVLKDVDAKQRNSFNHRQNIANCLLASSRLLGRYSTQNYISAGGYVTKETYELEWNLDKAIGGNSKPSYLGALSSSELGKVEAELEYFQQCLREFHEAEKATLTTAFEVPNLVTIPAKGTPAADILRYFPAVAAIPGTTDANALQQFTEWLLHWHIRHHPSRGKHPLNRQLREQQAAHTNAGKFLKACRRLHEALLPLAADEQRMKRLLGAAYSPHSCTNLVTVLTWWGNWIREQQAVHNDPAGAYLAALRRVPIVEEWGNDSPRYNLPAHLGIYDEFEAEITPLRQAFEAALLDLSTKKKRALSVGLNELLGIDRAGVQRRREQFEQGEYNLNFLPSDYTVLRFDIAGQSGGFKWQWVSPMFWGGLSTLLQYKQQAARAACEQLAAALPEATAEAVVPDTTEYYKNLGLPSPAVPAEVSAATEKALTITVASLCRDGFTPADLNELLVRLAVIDISGNCLTNGLRGKARGKRGAFTAAYRVLHRVGLLAPTATDREWASAFSREYGAELGADVIAHKLTQHGHAANLTPNEFQRAVDDAAEWAAEWKSRR